MYILLVVLINVIKCEVMVRWKLNHLQKIQQLFIQTNLNALSFNIIEISVEGNR